MGAVVNIFCGSFRSLPVLSFLSRILGQSRSRPSPDRLLRLQVATNTEKASCPVGEGVGGVLPCYGDVPLNRVWFLPLSESGNERGSTNQRFCLEQGILFAIPTLEHGRGDSVFCCQNRGTNERGGSVAVPARVPLHVHSNTPFPIRTAFHVFQSGTGYLFSRFCLKQGSKIASLSS